MYGDFLKTQQQISATDPIRIQSDTDLPQSLQNLCVVLFGLVCKTGVTSCFSLKMARFWIMKSKCDSKPKALLWISKTAYQVLISFSKKNKNEGEGKRERERERETHWKTARAKSMAKEIVLVTPQLSISYTLVTFITVLGPEDPNNAEMSLSWVN